MLETILLSSLNKVFPDERPVDAGFNHLSLLKKEYGGFQLAIKSEEEKTYQIKIESELNVRCFEVKLVPAKKICNTGDDYYVRKTSGLYPDLLCECSSITVDNNYRSLWFEIYADNIKSGVYPVKIMLCENGKTVCEKKTDVEIIPVDLPEQDLICTNWFHTDCIHTYYDVPVFSEEYWNITEKFVREAVKHGINMLLTPLFTPPLDTAVGKERPTVQLVDVAVDNGKYSFGFDKLRRWIDMCDRCGIKYFEMSHLFTQWGAMHTPKIMACVDGKNKQIFGWKTWASSKKYTDFLCEFAKELCGFIKEEGIMHRCYFHISDEPSMERLKDYGKRSKLIRNLFGEFPIIDALSDFDFYKKGLIKNPIPCIPSAEKFYGNVDNLWVYYCCGPDKDYYTNRFFGMPMQRTRVLGYQMYKYNVKGFLQWGLNFWYSQLSDHPINPFETSDSDGAFPAGDAFVLYPGNNGEPLSSIRFKAFREGLQDQRALNLLESLIGREETLSVLQREGEISFSDYPRSSDWHLRTREKINSEIAKAISCCDR